MSKAIDRILALLPDAKKNGTGWLATCPAHPDENPSLSISEGKAGRVLLKCFAGCRTEDVVKALNLSMTDLFDNPAPRKTATTKPRNKKVWPSPQSFGRWFAKKKGFRVGGGWLYQNFDGTDHLTMLRFDSGPGVKEYRPLHPVDGGWRVGDPSGKLPLYNLPTLLNAPYGTVVYVVEGEKCVEAAASIGLLATTSAHGVKGGNKTEWLPLRNQDIVILPDNDAPGAKYATTVARHLTGIAASIKIVRLPGLPERGDIADFIAKFDSRESEDIRHDIETLAAAAPVWTPPADEAAGEKLPQAEVLTRLCEVHVKKFFRDQYGDPYVLLPIENHFELHSTSARRFREHWLAGLYRKLHGKPPGSEALKQARIQVEAKCHSATSRTLNNRVGWDKSTGSLWYDLSNENWQGIEITKKGWKVRALPPIFRRYKHQVAQVTPVSGGDPRKFLKFCNMNDIDHCLFLAAIGSYFIPDIPHPLLVFLGEPGSAKSTVCKMIHMLVDPSAVPLLSVARKQEELQQAIDHNWVAPFDNITWLPTWLSDLLCRAVTGEGYYKRSLYTDDDAFLRFFRRCIMLTGISSPAFKGDLLDRSILFELRKPEKPREEGSLWKEFDEALPRILGGFLDALVEGLNKVKEVRTVNTQKLRMADFCVWGCALAEPLGFSEEQFITDYSKATKGQLEDAVHTNLLASELIEFVKDSPNQEWSGNATALYSALSERGKDSIGDKKKEKSWMPKSAAALGRALRELAAALRSTGLAVKFARRRTISLSFSEERDEIADYVDETIEAEKTTEREKEDLV